MTIVVPAGNKNVEWVKEDQPLQKTASTGEIAQETVNPLYEAAKKYLQAKKDKEAKKDCEKCKKDPCECKATKEAAVEDLNKDKEEKKEDKPAEAPKADGAVANVEQAVKEVVQKAEEAEKVIEKVEVAVEKIEQAVQEVKTVVQKEVPAATAPEAGEQDSIEIEVADEEPSIELEVEKPDGDKGLIVESEPDVESCMAKKKVGMDKAASSEEFCRYSMISQDNRKKLYDYWVNALGFPKDYVKLLVKD
jgi:hypothetical protein